jgi:hypothetical protein
VAVLAARRLLDGKPLVTKAGTIRTFGDREAARKAAEKEAGR